MGGRLGSPVRPGRPPRHVATRARPGRGGRGLSTTHDQDDTSLVARAAGSGSRHLEFAAPTSRNTIRRLPWMARGAAGTSSAHSHSRQPVPPPAAHPTIVQPHPCPSWGSGFLSADVGVLRPGVATRPAVLIDKAAGVRPVARLERMIADMRLQLADVIIHHGPPLVAAADGPRFAGEPVRKIPYSMAAPASGPTGGGLLDAHDAHRRPCTGRTEGTRAAAGLEAALPDADRLSGERRAAGRPRPGGRRRPTARLLAAGGPGAGRVLVVPQGGEAR
jgi:hypothetical protein